MKRALYLFILLLLVASSSVTAQDELPPLLILRFLDETVYQYQDGEVTSLDECVPDGEFRAISTLWPSPDGFRFAFLTRLPSANGNANNLHICDLRDRRWIPVTRQPQTQFIHSAPAWSPDGGKLAFTRLIQGQNRMEFVLYDLADNSEQVVYQRDMTVSSSSLPQQVAWGAVGPVAFNVNIQDQARPAVSEYVWYPQEFITQAAEGAAVVRQLDSFYESLQLVTLDDPMSMSYVVSNYGQPGKALDLATNEVVDLGEGSIVTINPLAPQLYAHSVVISISPEWSINGSNFSTALGIPAPVSESLAISPDGQQLAFITFENYPRGGKVYVVTDISGFIQSMGGEQFEAVVHLPEFDAHYGEPGALGLYWGPSALALRP
jgi:hypothetical protein